MRHWRRNTCTAYMMPSAPTSLPLDLPFGPSACQTSLSPVGHALSKAASVQWQVSKLCIQLMTIGAIRQCLLLSARAPFG